MVRQSWDEHTNVSVFIPGKINRREFEHPPPPKKKNLLKFKQFSKLIKILRQHDRAVSED